MSLPLIELNHIAMSFKKGRTQTLTVLQNIHLSIMENEIVAVLGKSGSGKSTLLRIMAGLITPSEGSVLYRGEPIHRAAQGLGMVFQNFALFPWLTVLQNVELGLEAQGIARAERRKRALKVIDTIGLDGFETAYPKELSGGMRQRVGIARALVINPDILIMDEPFSALDVLTADNLQNDLLDLWHARQTNTKSILFVTHNISEAVFLADRILIFGSNPGYIRTELKNDLPHPRHTESTYFKQMVDKIYALMTMEELSANKRSAYDVGYRIPRAAVPQLIGLIETLNTPENKGSLELPPLADSLQLDIDDLFPLTEALEILAFAQVSQGRIQLNTAGKLFAEADILMQKKIFADHLMQHCKLAQYIRKTLDERENHRVSEERFLAILENYLTEQESERVLRTIIDWGRYAELFAYDANTSMLSLENPN